MKRFTKSILALSAIPLLFAAVPANAALLLSGNGVGTTLVTSGVSGGTQTINFNGIGGDPVALIAGLTSKLTLTFNSITNSGKTFNFGYTIVETSSAPITASRIPQFGFNTNPNIASASSTGLYDNVYVPSSDGSGGNVPNVGQVEMCFKDLSKGNCAGGGKGGVTFNQSATGTLALTFGAAQSSISLDNFFVRYQSIAGAGMVTSAVGRATTTMAPVPEPAAWMMMILGFGWIGFAMRKRNGAAQARIRFA